MGHIGPGPDNCKALSLDDNEYRGCHKLGELMRLYVPKSANDTCLIYHLYLPFSFFYRSSWQGLQSLAIRKCFSASLFNDFWWGHKRTTLYYVAWPQTNGYIPSGSFTTPRTLPFVYAINKLRDIAQEAYAMLGSIEIGVSCQQEMVFSSHCVSSSTKLWSFSSVGQYLAGKYVSICLTHTCRYRETV